MMKAAGLTEISFLYDWNPPVFRRDGIKYKLMDVSWENGQVWLNVIPSYTYSSKTYVMDATWNKNTRKHILNLVAARISKMN